MMETNPIGTLLMMLGFITATVAALFSLECLFARKPEITETNDGDFAKADVEGTEPEPPEGGWCW